MDVLVSIDLGGEEHRARVGHSEVPALHRKGQEVLWDFGNLETAQRGEKGPVLQPEMKGNRANRMEKTLCPRIVLLSCDV